MPNVSCQMCQARCHDVIPTKVEEPYRLSYVCFFSSLTPKNPWAPHGRGRTLHSRGPGPQNPICLRVRILRVASYKVLQPLLVFRPQRHSFHLGELFRIVRTAWTNAAHVPSKCSWPKTMPSTAWRGVRRAGKSGREGWAKVSYSCCTDDLTDPIS